MHVATETLFEDFMRNPERHLSWFLASQRAGLLSVHMSRTEGSDTLSAHIIEDLLDRLDFDLAVRNVSPRQIDPEGPLDPLSVDYLILGSRLGTTMLYRRLFAANGPGIPAYFLAPSDTPLWQRFLKRLNALDPALPRAARIIDDARTGFSLFSRAAQIQTH
ncbi:hypothetical protein ACRARG_17415 [Pseudooceanicola sp. C21-150M6]|uniref:hypothetical protein n=1 Tax=Pseudooceanicola sp. C21-150M6 TaxID=3434355 RepID=UPI003D7F8A1F